MMKSFKIIFLLCSLVLLLSTSTFAQKGQLNLKVQSPHLSYQLATQGRYLRFRTLGQEVGFYLKACHAQVVEAIEGELKKSLLSLSKAPPRAPAAQNETKKEKYAGIQFNGAYYKVAELQFKRSDYPYLQSKIFRLMTLGKKRCP